MLIFALGAAVAATVALHGCMVTPSDHAPGAAGCTDDPACSLGVGGSNGGGSPTSGGTPGSSGAPAGPGGSEAGTEAGVAPTSDASTGTGGETTPVGP